MKMISTVASLCLLFIVWMNAAVLVESSGKRRGQTPRDHDKKRLLKMKSSKITMKSPKYDAWRPIMRMSSKMNNWRSNYHYWRPMTSKCNGRRTVFGGCQRYGPRQPPPYVPRTPPTTLPTDPPPTTTTSSTTTTSTTSTTPEQALLWTQQGQYIFDIRGVAPALSADGKTMAVVMDDYNSISVYRYTELDGLWEQLGPTLQAIQDPNDEINKFTGPVALSSNGEILALQHLVDDGIGYYDAYVRVFQFNRATSQWESMGSLSGQQYLEYSFGDAISMSANGKVIAVGTPRTNEAGNEVENPRKGLVNVYMYDETAPDPSWTQLGQTLLGDLEQDWFGRSVSLSADAKTLAVGAPRYFGFDENGGQARVFTFSDGTGLWEPLGQMLYVTGQDYYFGQTVALSGDGRTLAVAAPENSDVNGLYSGQVSVFRFNQENSRWEDLGQRLHGVEYFGSSFGLSADGHTLVVGEEIDDAINDSKVHSFRYNESTELWESFAQTLYGVPAYDWFGLFVALSADGGTLAMAVEGTQDTDSYVQIHVLV